jgi:fructose-1,6-bisphosphatase I
LGTPCVEADFLQPGSAMKAAGYVIYGSSTMLVYATKLGVNGFTLEPSIGEFCLSHPGMKVKENGKIYSINQGNTNKLNDKLKSYLNYCMDEEFSHRYIGSMVADLHRTLIKGGIFMYPADLKNKNGKLRLIYECNPMTYIVEKAGGLGTTGNENILDIKPQELHQRVPIFIGSKSMVEKAVEMIN